MKWPNVTQRESGVPREAKKILMELSAQVSALICLLFVSKSQTVPFFTVLFYLSRHSKKSGLVLTAEADTPGYGGGGLT